MPVDPELQPILDLINAGTPMSAQNPEEARDAFRMLTVGMRNPDLVVPVASVVDGTVAGAEGPLPTRVYRPDAIGLVPTVVLFHGGGFVIGDLDTHDSMARSLCAGTGSVVVSVDYRLAPEHPYPAAALDAIAATTAVLSDLDSYGGSPVVGVAGDSAGGNLSAVVAQQVPGIAAQLLVYPATDLIGDYPSRAENATGYLLDEDTMNWFMGQYLSAGPDPVDPRLAPLHGELAGLPPAIVVVAELDPLRDEGVAYAEAMDAAGVTVTLRRYDGLIHGFFDLGGWSKASQAAIEETIGLFAELLAAG
ncbi:MAG TPA: alpha/beta hydrolase [Marmoricola sp.]|jgi:acetyl esterase|nr:alpha/beta hydrolase [Marmoricola sp.]